MTYLDVSADSVIILSLALCLELEWCSIDIQNNGSSVVCSFEKKKKTWVQSSALGNGLAGGLIHI